MCVVLVLAVASTMAVTRAEPQPTLTVRLYNPAAIPPIELLTAGRTAEAILRETDLDVMVRHCGRPVLPEHLDRCDEPLQASEVVVRVINAAAFNTGLPADAYGVTYVVQKTNRGWLATVFSDRIEKAAVRAGVDAGTLLGRVMAHEVGHLLLGVDYHGASGLMRAEWPDGQLGATSDQWRFSTSEAAGMHRALESISRELDAAPPLTRF